MATMKQVAEVDKDSTHTADVECILLHGDQVYTAADDGKVKVWDKDLKLQKEIQAHDYAVYHLLVFKERLFTASIDATIKVWKLPSLELQTTLTGSHEEAVRRLATNGERIFSGDEKGDVIVWDGDSLASTNRYETVEEVWDLAARDCYFFCVRDRGLNVTEVKKDDTNMFSVVKSLQGRAPIYVSEKYLMYSQFGTGYGLHLHKYEPRDFSKIADLKAHDAIITCLSGNTVAGAGERAVSGGYDNKLILWDLDKAAQLTTCAIAVTPSCVALGSDGTVYYGGPDGVIGKVTSS